MRFRPAFAFAGASALAFLAASASPVRAILRRHDAPDSAYRALVPPDHPCVVVGGIANGTLVGPQWVLTAAHVVDGVSPFRKLVHVGGVDVPFDSIRYHPGASRDGDAWVDLALLHLARPVAGVKPARLYDRDDESEQVVLFVGTGNTGDGRGGVQRGTAGAWRGATNRVRDVTPRTIRFVFDAPALGEPLEGISGPGDSGGPALVTRDGETWITGVSSTNDQPDGQPLCTYGTVETYARVSTARAWIDSVMNGNGTPSPGSDWTAARKLGTWPSGVLARLARDWFAARNANQPPRLEAFVQAHGDSSYRARRSAAERATAYAELWKTFGKYTPVAWSTGRDGTLAVLVRAANDGLWLDYRFVPSTLEPGRLARIESTDLNVAGESFAWPPR